MILIVMVRVKENKIEKKRGKEEEIQSRREKRGQIERRRLARENSIHLWHVSITILNSGLNGVNRDRHEQPSSANLQPKPL